MTEPGELLDGRYRIIRLIGEGGMGAVYEGENTSIHRRVAIKVLHPGAAGNSDAVVRFEREAQAAGRIGSDHILEVLDLGRLPGGERYMVMEFLDGEPLSQRIRGLGKMSVEQIVPLAHQILVGLAAAHAAGIIHRDLKPDNIFVLREKAGLRDFVKLIDFGISKFNAMTSDMSMTRTGAVMGTPYYMAPEQAKGSADVDHRSDLYSIGVVLYEAATGQVPFNASTFNELLFKIVLSEPPPLREVVPDIDPSFAAFVEKAMAKDPADRFSTASEMLSALGALAPPGVALPASPAFSSTIQPNASAPAFGATSTGHAGTQGSFSASQAGQASSPPRRRATLGIVAGAAGLLLVGGALAAYKVASSSEAAAVPSVAPAAVSSPSDARLSAPVDVAPKRVEEEIAPTVAAPSATPSVSLKEPARSAKGPGASRPPVAAAPAPAKAAPAVAPAAGATPKRRDFGY